MTTLEAICERHSVRSYLNKPIESDIILELEKEINECNSVSGLHIQLVTNEPNAFGKSLIAHYGKFRNVCNYLCLVGPKDSSTDVLLGYYGERIVLKAQQLHLNTCWVGLSYSKGNVRCDVATNERMKALIAIGYGESQGIKHKSKTPKQICSNIDLTPSWFKSGIDAVLLAPTAMNQQKFQFEYLPDRQVKASTKWGFYSKIDLGIAKLHFELGAGRSHFEWAEATD